MGLPCTYSRMSLYCIAAHCWYCTWALLLRPQTHFCHLQPCFSYVNKSGVAKAAIVISALSAISNGDSIRARESVWMPLTR